MLLQEISDNPNETVAELSVLKQAFPKSWRKIVEQLVKKQSRLKFAGYDIYDVTGFGPAIYGLTNAFKEVVKQGKVEVEVEFKTQQYTDMVPIHDANLVAIYYSHKDNCIFLGYDAWIDPEDFNRSFDAFFEKENDEPFDYDNPDHEEVYDHAVQEFNKVGMYGLLIKGTYASGFPRLDVFHEAARGFFKGIEPLIQPLDLIKL